MPHRHLWQIVGFLQLAVIAWLSLTPSPPHPPVLTWDKAQHSLAYGLVAWWFAMAFARGWRWPIVLAAFGIGMEVLQGLGGIRTMDHGDALANIVGVVLGTAAGRGPAGRLLPWIDRRWPVR